MAHGILHNCVDEISEKGAKHVEHKSSVSKLVPLETRRGLEALLSRLSELK